MGYCPDRWVVVKMDKYFKVFATWFGNYANGDSWRINSGIVSVSLDCDHYIFSGYSGNEYLCHRDSYGTSVYTDSVLGNIAENCKKNQIEFEVLPDDFDFLNLEIENDS